MRGYNCPMNETLPTLPRRGDLDAATIADAHDIARAAGPDATFDDIDEAVTMMGYSLSNGPLLTLIAHCIAAL